ncbi:hypothetical protein GE061_020201 [Apolygus lucorum]|uniref:Uncharacterized protein n=2 Tax=Apolygus lucorum TaxID=248454 RepID=A0A8S9WNN1_APOLU|nr:hypothetical protein GE061_020201 [Apolygus lucorum]
MNHTLLLEITCFTILRIPRVILGILKIRFAQGPEPLCVKSEDIKGGPRRCVSASDRFDESSELGMSLNRSQRNNCSTEYNTPPSKKVVYRRFRVSTSNSPKGRTLLRPPTG